MRKLLLPLLLLSLSGKTQQQCQYKYLPMPDNGNSSLLICAMVYQKENTKVIYVPKIRPVDSIFFINSTVREISAATFEHFKNVSEIHINGSWVHSIHSEAFGELLQLERLYLQNNNISSVAAWTESLASLKLLDLSHNAIFKCSFQGLQTLEELYLSYNRIIEITAFEFHMESLKVLDLSHNYIYNIYAHAFDALPSLALLRLEHNILPNLPTKLLEDRSNLTTLDVSSNKLKEFSLQSLPSLSHLNVKNNFNNSVVWATIAYTALREIDFSDNCLTEIYVAPAWAVVHFSGNNLTHLRWQSFRRGVNLTYLDLSFNKIGEISEDAFNSLSELRVLNLSHNSLDSLPVGGFKNLNLLEELKLSRNYLVRFDFGTFAGLSNLRHLHLDRNEIKEIPEKSFFVLSDLRMLNLTLNRIKELNLKMLLNQLETLKFIFIDRNDWECDYLVDLIKLLTTNHIGFVNGTRFDKENVFGISCTANAVADAQPGYSSGSVGFNSVDEAFRNSTFYKFFNNDFRKSSFSYYLNRGFRKANFFKYFNVDFSNSSFFKFFNGDFKNSSFYSDLLVIFKKLVNDPGKDGGKKDGKGILSIADDTLSSFAKDFGSGSNPNQTEENSIGEKNNRSKYYTTEDPPSVMLSDSSEATLLNMSEGSESYEETSSTYNYESSEEFSTEDYSAFEDYSYDPSTELENFTSAESESNEGHEDSGIQLDKEYSFQDEDHNETNVNKQEANEIYVTSSTEAFQSFMFINPFAERRIQSKGEENEDSSYLTSILDKIVLCVCINVAVVCLVIFLLLCFIFRRPKYAFVSAKDAEEDSCGD